jgi:hypothetical protein
VLNVIHSTGRSDRDNYLRIYPLRVYTHDGARAAFYGTEAEDWRALISGTTSPRG